MSRRSQLQVLDPKNKGPPTCKCPDCLKKAKAPSTSQSQSKSEIAVAFPTKKTANAPKNMSKKDAAETKTKHSISQSKQSSVSHKNKQLPQEDLSDTCESCKVITLINLISLCRAFCYIIDLQLCVIFFSFQGR